MPNSCKLSELLSLDRRKVDLVNDRNYTEIGIYSFFKGIFHKSPRKGWEVGDKDLYTIKKDDFIFQITFSGKERLPLHQKKMTISMVQ